jgi:hypothetical protein
MSIEKDRLLAKARELVEAGDKALRDAAEALALAKVEHDATQQEMAEAVGKSQAWVSRLLRWPREEYKEESPFGPTTKAERDYQHANKRKKRHLGTKPRRSKPQPTAPDANKEESAAQETATDNVHRLEPERPQSKLLAEFKVACSTYIPGMTKAEIEEALSYVSSYVAGLLKVA